MQPCGLFLRAHAEKDRVFRQAFIVPRVDLTARFGRLRLNDLFDEKARFPLRRAPRGDRA